MKNKLYVINGKTYLSHINDEVHLYGFLHQLAFLAGRIKDEEDVFHVLDFGLFKRSDQPDGDKRVLGIVGYDRQ